MYEQLKYIRNVNYINDDDVDVIFLNLSTLWKNTKKYELNLFLLSCMEALMLITHRFVYSLYRHTHPSI